MGGSQSHPISRSNLSSSICCIQVGCGSRQCSKENTLVANHIGTTGDLLEKETRGFDIRVTDKPSGVFGFLDLIYYLLTALNLLQNTSVSFYSGSN